MKLWIDGLFMAWGMFCAIPTPSHRWNEQARGHMTRCLPLIGCIIGAVWALAAWLLRGAPSALRAFCLAALPWVLSGFLHLDGFMDVCDAILSRRDLATRQRILKDSHCGAFAVIGIVPFIGPGIKFFKGLGAAGGLKSVLKADFFRLIGYGSGGVKNWATGLNALKGSGFWGGVNKFSAEFLTGKGIDDWAGLGAGGWGAVDAMSTVWSTKLGIVGMIKDTAGGAWGSAFGDRNPFS